MPLTTRYPAVRQENQDAMAGKAKSRQAGTRAALGNISNQSALVTRAQAKQAEKSLIQKPVTRLAKSKASDLQTTQKEPEVTHQETVPMVYEEPAPAQKVFSPMDISASEAFSTKAIKNIDAEDVDSPQLVSIYVNKIYEYLRDMERKFDIEMNFLDGKEINARMRGILVDWIVQVHMRFHLLQETLYLAVGIIDRFLQVEPVSRKKLQLVGVTAMLIACKYEEMYAPEIGDYVYITDNAYSKENIRNMECIILKTLDFALGRPLPLHFLRRNSKAGEVDATKHTLAKYLMELSITEYDMAHIYPSEIAAAALCLSMKVFGNESWSETLVHHSKYTEEELMPTMKKMARLVTKAKEGKLTAIHTKYKSSKFNRISIVPELKSSVITSLAETDFEESEEQ